MSLVKRDLVNVSNIDYSDQSVIECVHGEQRMYPTVGLNVTINDQMYLLKVGVVECLSVDLILGRDFPILGELLALNILKNVEISCPVITRAQ